LSAANKAYRFIHPKVTAEKEADYFFIKTENQLIKIPYDDILYIKSMQNYTIFYTHEGKTMALLPMKQVIRELPEDRFVQTHKSYVVAIEKVKAIEDSQVLIGKESIPISTRMRKEVIKLITGNRILKK
ncbi:MAG: LytTR family DNA-binding domain-containing protein, partial [Bacteroidota bacterium]